MNKIERIFEKHCKAVGSIPHKIPREDGIRTPDYYFQINGKKIIAEVTSLNKNTEELDLGKKVAAKKPVAWWPNSENRLRSKINDKGTQLKNKTKGKYPGILIIFDNRGPFDTLSNDDFRFAMYGNDTIKIRVPDDANYDPIVTGEEFGGSRRMTEKWKIYISAMAHLKLGHNGKTSLSLYHNFFASIPLDYNLCWNFADSQFKIDNPHIGEQKYWIEIQK